ncbi:MAG: hypothetical protein GC192_19695 [Bacteroidetes bacterium]|nr:hypothetical protein [Bacteroidota bacterium]
MHDITIRNQLPLIHHLTYICCALVCTDKAAVLSRSHRCVQRNPFPMEDVLFVLVKEDLHG